MRKRLSLDLKHRGGVYQIECRSTRQIYIGATTDFDRRLNEHFFQLRQGTHPNRRMQFAFARYGENAFTWKVLEYCAPVMRFPREQWYLDHWRPFWPKGFNVIRTAGMPGDPLTRPPRTRHVRRKDLGARVLRGLWRTLYGRA